MDNDVAAILGLTPLELRRGVAGFGRLGSVRPSTWAFGAAAVLLPAIAVAVILPLIRARDAPRSPAVATVETIQPPMAMRVGPALAVDPPAPGDNYELATLGPPRAVPPAPSRSRAEPAPARRVEAPSPRPTMPPSDNEIGGEAASIRPPAAEETPPTILQVREEVVEPPVRREIVAARLEAVDALRALRQK